VRGTATLFQEGREVKRKIKL